MAEDDFDISESPVASSGGRFKIKLETLIPILIIVAVVLFLVFKTNIFSEGTGVFGANKASILVIGSPSPELTAVLKDFENKDLIKESRQLAASDLVHNPKDRIKNYDIVILDQSMSLDKSLSRTTGEAITSFVKSGGSLIVVLNSGIERTGDASVIGWKATFDDIVPVTCDASVFSVPSCKQTLRVNGTIYANRYDSKQGGYKIMYGIEKVPAMEAYGLISTEAYPVHAEGTEIAYMVDARTNMTYTAIVEEPLLLGKVIYFNFNPGLSEAILINTIKYLS